MAVIELSTTRVEVILRVIEKKCLWLVDRPGLCSPEKDCS